MDHPPRTRLEQLIRASKRTIEENRQDFMVTATRRKETGASLSYRQLTRWMSGELDSARLANERMAEAHWGEPFPILMGPPLATPPATPGAAPSAVHDFNEFDGLALPGGEQSPETLAIGRSGALVVDLAARRAERDPDGIAQLVSAFEGQRAVEVQVAHHLRQVLVETRHLDDLLGPGDLVGPVNSQLRLVASLIRSARDEQVRCELWTLAAELSQFLAWLLLDLGHYDQADACYRRGLRAAHEADDADLHSYLLGWLSFVASYRQQPGEALAFASAARSKGRDSVCQPLRSWLVAIEARALAVAGDEACLGVLEAARDEMAEPQRAESPTWLYHFDEVALRGYRGTTLVILGQAEAGATLIRETTKRLDANFVRARAIYDTLLMAASARQGDLTAACDHGVRALDVAVATGSRRGVLTVQHQRNELPSSRCTAVEYLDERLLLAAAGG